MTIQDLSKKLNISTSTISRVLNNSKSVKPETRAKVVAAVEETGYVPNLIARGLRTRTNTVAVVTQDILNPYYIEALYAIEKICRENGYVLMSLNSDNSTEIEKQNLMQLLSMKVRGVILLANMLTEHERMLLDYRENKMPIVTMEGCIDGIDSVTSDCAPGIYEAMDYLISMGHTKIGMCHGSMQSYPIQERIRQTKLALEQHGHPFDSAFEFFGDDYLAQLEAARAECRLPSVLFTLNDNTAINVYRWCKSVSLRIPEDMSVLGFDNVSLADILSPPLTTISQPIGYLTELAIKQLIVRMKSAKEMKYVNRIQVPTQLIVRHSVARHSVAKIK